MTRTRRSVVAVVLLVAAFLGLGAGTASAHAALVSTDPASGSTVTDIPAAVTLHFSEHVEVGLGGLKVFAPNGSRVDTGSVSHGADGDSAVTVHVRGGGPQGTYTVAWRVVSADSHVVSGAFTFNVGHESATSAGAAASSESGDSTVQSLESAARGLAYLGFAVLAGSVLFLLVCRPESVTRLRVWVTMFASWAALLVGTVGVIALQGPNGSGLGLGSVFDGNVLKETLDTRLGRALSVRVLLLGAAGAFLGYLVATLADTSGERPVVAPPRRRVAMGAVWGLLCTALAVTWSASDHASVGMQAPLAMVADTVHLLSMGGWLGGLALLVVLLVRPGPPDAPGAIDAQAVGRFSRIAFACVSALVVTGVYAAWRQLGSWGALIHTTYGWLLVAKVDLVLLMLGGAWTARRWVARRQLRAALDRVEGVDGPDSPGTRPGWGLLRKAVAAEAVLAIGVLGVTTVLVNENPPRTASEVAGASAGPVTRTVPYDTGSPGGTGAVTVTLDPARTGVNTLKMSVTDATGAVRNVPEVDASAALPAKGIAGIPLLVSYEGPGSWQATGVALPLPGTWQLKITVRTTDIDEATVSVPVEVK